jgi:Predicted membrane protein (DUF2142).
MAAVFLVASIFILRIKKLENIFLVIALVCGIILIFVARPFYGFDEADHLARIYDISNNHFFPTIDDDGWPVASVPSGFTSEYYGSYAKILRGLKYETKGEYGYKNNMEYTGVYSPLSYVIQIPMMWLARIITNRPVAWTYIVRIGQLVISALLVREIIKRAKVAQKVFFVIALLPATMEALSFVSADTIFSIATLALVSTTLNIVCAREKIDKNNKSILLLSALFVASGKLVFAPLIFVLFLIPMHTKKKKDYLRVIFTIVPILLLVLFWNALASPYMMGAQGLNAGHQISHYLSNPLEFVQVMGYSFFHSSGNHLSDLLGGNNRWYGPTINDGSLLPIIFAIMLIIVMLNEKFELSKGQRWLIAGIMVVEIGFIMGVMLLVCMPPYHSEIVGVQGRYFTMLIPFAAMLLARKKNNLQFDIWRYVPLVIMMTYMIFAFRIVLPMCYS